MKKMLKYSLRIAYRLADRAHAYYQAFGIKGFLLFMRELSGDRREVNACLKENRIKTPIYLRLNSSDITTLIQVILAEEYQIKLGKIPKVIVDAGANIGLASIYFSNLYPDAKIYAIEPERDNYKLLVKNTAEYANITNIHAALWNNNTQVNIYDRNVGSWGFAVNEAGDALSDMVYGVAGVTLYKVMEIHKIDYIDILKVDIEGSEKELFQDADVWVKKVGVIAIELHDHIKMGCKRAFYNATNDFEYECQRGENVFVVKSQYMPNGTINTECNG